MPYLSTWDANLYVYRVLPYSKVWNFWLNYKVTVRKEQKLDSSTRQVGQESLVAAGQASPSPAGPKPMVSVCDRQSRGDNWVHWSSQIRQSKEAGPQSTVHSPARTSVLNLLPDFLFGALFFFIFGKQQIIAPYLHSLCKQWLCVPFSCYLFSRMKSFNQFNLLLYSSQIWSSLLPTSVTCSGFMCLSWDRVTRRSIQDAKTLLHTVV